MSRQAALANNPLSTANLAKSLDVTSNLRSLFDRGGSGNIRKQSTVRLEWIRPDPNQPRQTFSPEEMEALKSSIQTYGVIEPILVRLVGETYQIICGERRFRAAQDLGLAEIPVVVREVSDDEAFILSLQENVQRNDLTPIEEARAYKAILDKGIASSLRELARILGVSHTRVSRKLELLELSPELQSQMTAAAPAGDVGHIVVPGAPLCDDSHETFSEEPATPPSEGKSSRKPSPRQHRLTERHIRAVRRLASSASQKLLFDQIAAKRLSVSQTEQLIDQVLANAGQPDEEPIATPVLRPVTTWTIGDVELTEDASGLHIHVKATSRPEQIAQLRQVLESLAS